MVVTYYIKLLRTGADRHNVILMFLLLLVTETINGCKLLKIFERVLMFNPNEPIKVVHLQKQANQPILNCAIVISTIIFMNARKALFLSVVPT